MVRRSPRGQERMVPVEKQDRMPLGQRTTEQVGGRAVVGRDGSPGNLQLRG